LVFTTDYDLGRQGEAYFDITTTNTYNSGSAYRNDSVDIQATDDTLPKNGYNVGWIDAGDWMKYTVPIIPMGAFSIAARVASLSGGGKFYIEVGGSNVTDLISVPATGGWQSWATLAPVPFTNTIPASSFRVVVDTGGFNLNWLQFTSLLPVPPAGLKASATPAQVQLNWNTVSGAIGYTIKRAASSGGTYLTIATGISGTNFTDVNITSGATFFYVVTAINSYGESTSSNEAVVVVPFPRLAVSVSAANLMLTWSNSASAMLLRSTTNLAPPVVWLPVTNTPIFQNGRWQVSWPTAAAVRFFQLSAE
jgi:hypothetical protein